MLSPEKIKELRKILAKTFRAMNDSRLKPETRKAAKNYWKVTKDWLDAQRQP